MTLDSLIDWLSLLGAGGAALLASGLLVRALTDRAAVRRSGANGALLVVSDSAVAIEALRLTMAALLLAYAVLVLPLAGTSIQFHISRWLHIVMSAVMIGSAIYHYRQRRRLLGYLEGTHG